MVFGNAVYAPIVNQDGQVNGLARGVMKRPLDEAAELFRENEARAGQDREKANLYHGLSLLAQSLRRVEKELEEVESEMQASPKYFYQRRRLRPLRRWIRAVATQSR